MTPVTDFDANAPVLQTDMGNARRFATQHKDRVRYVAVWGWVVWDGRRWKQDDTGGAVRLARVTVNRLFDDAQEAAGAVVALMEVAKEAAGAGDEAATASAKKAVETAQKKAAALMAHAIRSQSRPRIDALLALAQSEPEVAARPEDFDNAPWLLNCLNGTLDLRSGKLKPHDPNDMLTKLAGANYCPGAPCPTWAAFLERVQPDAAIRDFLQRSLGYTLTGQVGEQVFWFLYGTGANGKSVFSGVVGALLGDYAMKVRAEALMLKKQDTIPEEVAAMAGRRFALASELGDGQQLNESLVKDLTGGDRMRARYLHKNSFEFDPQAKVWMYGNHKPLVTGTDTGIWRRPRLVPFAVTIPEAERDPALLDKLLNELDGVLAWAVAGCLAWLRDGLRTPDAVRMATEEYRTDSDIIGRFLAECTKSSTDSIGALALYKVYKAWAENEGHKPMSNTAFGRKLSERGLENTRNILGKQYARLELTQSAADFA
jgi:putative DNA primase/helicase